MLIIFIKQSPKVKRIIGFILAVFVTLGLIFWRLPMILLLLILLISPRTEHVVEKNGEKYVACVFSGFTDTTVDYYDYINFFVMGNEEKITENYSGCYDPIKKQKEREKEEVYKSDNKDNEEQNNDYNIDSYYPTKYSDEVQDIVKEEDIIYKKTLKDNVSIRVVNRGNILGQKKIIQIHKTEDNGNKWINVINSQDRTITVNNEAEFLFINEKVGFINNLSPIILGSENDGLLVSVNGGKDFKSANFVFPLDVKDTMFYVKGLPQVKDNKLKLELFAPETIGSEIGNYYKFESIDNGLNWISVE